MQERKEIRREAVDGRESGRYPRSGGQSGYAPCRSNARRPATGSASRAWPAAGTMPFADTESTIAERAIDDIQAYELPDSKAQAIQGSRRGEGTRGLGSPAHLRGFICTAALGAPGTANCPSHEATTLAGRLVRVTVIGGYISGGHQERGGGDATPSFVSTDSEAERGVLDFRTETCADG